MTYYRTVRLNKDFDSAVTATQEALAAQGFGVLSRIDVAATLADKIGYEMENYVILGVCAPALARRALEIDRAVGMLLPCNVVVRGDDHSAVVQAADPDTVMSVTETPALRPVAREATAKIDAAMATLETPA